MSTEAPSVRDMTPEDWGEVRAIYEEGIAGGHSTFEADAPEWERWDAAHLRAPRLVAREEDLVVGWAALSPYSGRSVYAGVASVSIYVRSSSRGKGVGTALLAALIEASERAGFWTLQAGIFPENAPSLALFRRFGFRDVGRRERIGLMRRGPRAGSWRDVLLLERRLGASGDTGGDIWERVRASIVGSNAVVRTCFGERRITYADYTASGRALAFIEDYLRSLLAEYANTHTEDDATGRLSTERLACAERTIKRLLGAGDDYALIMVGSGTTAAVERLQQILGLSVPPASRDRLRRELDVAAGKEHAEALRVGMARLRPVVFVGPYEHHSNELSWRESDAEVVEIDLDPEGLMDLRDLERKVSDSRYADRERIGAFSACSNVTGLLTPVADVARILHRYGCLAVFDFAAVAPYRAIEVSPDRESYLDAIYFSPHKFLGGPGSAGVLLLRRALYRGDLAPTFAGGGTVEFVNWSSQDYVPDMESREKAGTPGILQTMRAALAMELKELLGEERIERREREVTRRTMERLASIEGLRVVGNLDPERRISIVSFVVSRGEELLHPRFVTQLLNDLFGIQSRAGCLCAGPYGHRLLGIDAARSAAFRCAIREGKAGLKPGWTRVSFHYLLTDREIDFICDAIAFVVREGSFFLPLYELDIATGAWHRRGEKRERVSFGLQEALHPAARAPSGRPWDGSEEYLAEAARLAAELRKSFDPRELRRTDPELVPFLYVHAR